MDLTTDPNFSPDFIFVLFYVLLLAAPIRLDIIMIYCPHTIQRDPSHVLWTYTVDELGIGKFGYFYNPNLEFRKNKYEIL